MPETNKRILIACPTCGIQSDPNEWLKGFLSIINQVHKLKLDHAELFPYKMPWFMANNLIWDTAFEHKFDYILRIDDDVHNIPYDALQNLIDAEKSIIGAAYPNRSFPYMPLAFNRTTEASLIESYNSGNKSLRSILPGESEEEIIKVDLIGFGLTLFCVKDFLYMPRPMFQGPENIPDDTYFAQLCMDNNIEQYVHFGVKISHRHVNFNNFGHLFNADIIASQQPVKKQ